MLRVASKNPSILCKTDGPVKKPSPSNSTFIAIAFLFLVQASLSDPIVIESISLSMAVESFLGFKLVNVEKSANC